MDFEKLHFRLEDFVVKMGEVKLGEGFCNKFYSQLISAKGKADLVNAYDSAGHQYDKLTQMMGYKGPQHLCDSFFTFNLPKEIKILYIGAGTGAVGKILHKHGYKEIHALDASPVMLQISEESPGVYSGFHECFITKDEPLPLPQNSYDAVLMAGVIFPNAMGAQELKQIIKVLKKGGILGLSTRTTPSKYMNEFFEGFANDMRALAEEGFWKPVAGLYPKTVTDLGEGQAGDLYFMQAL